MNNLQAKSDAVYQHRSFRTRCIVCGMNSIYNQREVSPQSFAEAEIIGSCAVRGDRTYKLDMCDKLQSDNCCKSGPRPRRRQWLNTKW